MESKEEDVTYDVVIIGAGPAGLTAAIYSGRNLLSTLVLERATPGGQLNETDYIENFPGFEEKIAGSELMNRMRKQAERLGATIRLDEVRGIDRQNKDYVIQLSSAQVVARSAIIASGSRPRELPAKGAKQLKGRGVSYCATCDGFFFQDKDILEVGAGESGLTEALLLAKFANSVKIVVRHTQDDPHAFRASPTLRKQVEQNPKISFLWNKTVEEVVGDTHLTNVILKDMATNETEERTADGLFVNIGHIPETEYLQGILDLDNGGYVVTDDRLSTNLPGIYAAGDVGDRTSRYAQAVVAAGDGAIAAIEVEKYLSERR